MAVAQHLPRGRHEAGDRHLKFHEDRDNLAVSVLDKITNKVQVLAGQATEKYGQATGNKQQQGRGRTNQARGNSKQPPRRSRTCSSRKEGA